MERLFCLAVLAWCGAGSAGGAGSEPLGAAVRRRSDGGGVYAQGYARRYEPALFVALPLHRPVPVLQVITASADAPVPARVRPGAAAAASAPRVYAASVPHAWHAQEPRTPVAHDSRTYYSKKKPVHYKTTSTWYGNKQQSETSSWYGEPSAADASPAPGQYGQRVRARPAAAAPAPAAPAGAWRQQPAAAAAAPDAADYYEPEEDLPEQEAAPVVLYARPAAHGGYQYRRRPAKPPQKAEPIIIRIHKHRVIRDD